MSTATETLFTPVTTLELRSVGDRRELDGICVPYGAPTTKVGPVPEVFHPGAFRQLVAALASKVRLTDHNHANPAHRRPVGVALAFEEQPGGLWGRFRFYNTPEGRAAWENVAEETYGGLSIGFRAVEERNVDGMRHIDLATLHHVSLVDEPAYEEARILAVRSAADEFGWLREPPRNVDLDNLEGGVDTLGLMARWRTGQHP